MASMKIRAACIKALEDAAGRCTASGLVEAASDPKHPLHGDFIWDNRKAAHEYRLHTARTIISSVRILVENTDKTITSVAYVRDPAAAKHEGYVSVRQLRTERENAEAALLAEMGQVQARLERARELAGALDLEDQVTDLIEGVSSFSSRIRKGMPSSGGEGVPLQ
jgi:hypothetical protein